MADTIPGSTSTTVQLTINSTYTGAINFVGDTDWFRVTLTAGVLYQFDLTGSGNDGVLSGLTLSDPWLALRNSSGTLLLSNDNSGLGYNSRIFYTPTTAGTYYLDAQESGVNATGIYRLIVNSSPISGTLTLGTPVSGSIGFSGNVDLYSVSLTAGVTYAFTVDGTTLSDPFLEILDSDGLTITSDDDDGSGYNAYVEYKPTTTGTYYLAVRESGNNATGNYTAKVSQVPTVSIADASVIEGDSGTTNLVFTLTLSSASSTPVTVNVGTSGTATATVGIDYIVTSANVTFTPGQTTATFTVPVKGDTIFEPTELFKVLLSNPSGATLGDSNAYGIIIDNDSPYSLPSDSGVSIQWYLYPTTGVNAFPVWADYTGAGVKVAVFDSGIDPNHPDLAGNLLTNLGRKATDLSAGGSPILATDNHGTTVAGTIAAMRNGDGIVGVAYDAKLVSIYSTNATSEIANAFTYAANFDVLNDSWGYAPQKNTYSWVHWAFYDDFSSPAFSAVGLALSNLAANGRNGLGTVVVQSAGNSYVVGDDTNLHNFQNSQYIILKTAVVSPLPSCR